MKQMFGDKLKTALKQRGVSQEQLARRTKISKGAIARYIDNSRQPVVENLILIAKAIGVEYGEIMTWFEDGEPNLKKESLHEKFLGYFDEMTDFEQEVYLNDLDARTKKIRVSNETNKKGTTGKDNK